MRALLFSAATLVAACNVNDAKQTPASRAELAPVALGTARAALISNFQLEVTGDTYLRLNAANENEGSLDTLSVQPGAVKNRTLLFFDEQAIKNSVGTGTLQSARVDLIVASNAGGWSGNRLLGIHALRQASSESGATWLCATDTDLANSSPDCSGASAWNMNATNGTEPFVPTPTATVAVGNGTFGVVSFDVTADVQAILAGAPAHGWLIKKEDENAFGSLRFASREQGPAPRLTLTVDAPEPCTPTASVDVTCDGLDDDCDGSADEDFVPLPSTCGVGACTQPGVLLCDSGELFNDCQVGEPIATGDASCDGVDDDCDGTSDEDYAGVETSCGVGACAAAGETSCAGGHVVDSCSPGGAATGDTTCDGVDDDCDGSADEDYVSVFTQCGIGACSASGSTSCVEGAIVDHCTPGAPAPVDTTCNGVDDDCDGSRDEDYVSVSTQCGVGACLATGDTSCVDGSVLDDCTPGPAASADTTCDGVDDDCDGQADEEYAPGCAGASTVTCSAGVEQVSTCSDGNACNGDESCTGAAQCVAGIPPQVNDDNPCTTDSCEPASGVTHVALAAGTICGDYRECNTSAVCESILPPDPADVAPALALGSTSFLDRVRFLYEGQDPIQTGVVPSVFATRSAAVVRGRVLGADGLPLPQVTVSVHAHPEFGSTLSRLDGGYDMVVNGGGVLTVDFDRNGVLGAQRTVGVPWQDYTSLDDVALIAHDGEVTPVSLPSGGPLLHAASVQDDARGARSARLFVPTGLHANLVLADGSSVAATELSIRASEYSVGAHPELAVPALLPQTGASAYAIELSADEAEDASAVAVELSRSASLYVENFIHLPVGTALPVGSYNRRTITWVGVHNGRVVELLGVSNGLADLDVDGAGSAANAQRLAALGIDDEERATLAATFAVGDEFFRVPVTTLGAFDVSLPFSVNAGTGGVDPKLPGQLAPLDDATLPAPAPENQVLSQSLPLAGTSFTLNYRSDRVLGSKRGQQLSIPAMGATVGSTLLGGVVDVQVAGQRHTFQVAPTASEVVNFAWNGQDVTGRQLHGWQRADIRVGLVEPRRFSTPEDVDGAFAHTSTGTPAIGDSPEPNVRWLRYDRMLHTFDSRQTDIGAWAINQHHQYDPKSRVVYRGDGTSFATRTTSTKIDRFAGLTQPSGSTSGDGGLALNARMDTPRSVAVGPDGALYIATRPSVRRVDPVTNVMTTVAGAKTNCNANLDQGSATELCVTARTIDFGHDGALYIADNPIGAGTFDRIRRLDPATGQMTTIAGARVASACSNMGDGGPANQAALCNLTAHATAPDGSIYLLDRGNTSNPLAIRKISTDGTIDTIGHANWSANDDAAALAVGPDGSLYVAQDRSVLRILPTGEQRHFAGNVGSNGNSGEGGSATVAKFGTGGPAGIWVGPDGRAFIGDNGNAQIRMVDQQGIIRRVAGTNINNGAGYGGSPLNAGLGAGVLRTALGPDGAMFVTSRGTHTVSIIRPSIAGDFSGQALVPSPSGNEVYRFDADGRHLETTSSANGALLYSFGYDAAKRLVSVTNSTGGVTVIERDEDGNPTRIIAPSGEETLLDTNALGYVTNVVGPDGAESELAYDAGGLLTSVVDSSGATHTYTYDADGRLLTP